MYRFTLDFSALNFAAIDAGQHANDADTDNRVCHTRS